MATEDTTLTVSTVAIGVIDNDDEGNAPATVTSFDATSTQSGAVAVAADGTFAYTPDTDFVGIDTFTYTICDDDNPASPTSCDTATVTIIVTAMPAANNPPVATDDSFTTSEDTTLTDNVLTDGVPDSDVDSDPLLVDTTPTGTTARPPRKTRSRSILRSTTATSTATP